MPKSTCSIDGCERTVVARSWCNRHYRRWIRHGDPLAGGSYQDGRGEWGGYVWLHRPGHPIANSKGYVQEHRLVAWEAGLLSAAKFEPRSDAVVVHHINGVKTDNRLENLRVTTLGEHTADHHRLADTCSVDGCEKLHSARGWCHMHYMHWWNRAS